MGVYKVGLLVIAIVGYVHQASANTTIATETIGYHTVSRERVFDAYIEAQHQSTLSAQTAGRVAQVRFDVGEFVPKGEVIIRFRDKEQRAALEAAEAKLANAQARFVEAEAEFKRIQEVYAKKLVSKAALDKASADIKSAQAGLNEAQARVKEANEGMEHTVVRSPYAGVVVKRHIEVGESARVGDPLMTGLSMQTLRANASVPQAILSQVLKHNQVRIILPQQDERKVEAKRMVMLPCDQPVCSAYTIRIDLADDIEGLFPGMLVKVAFTIGTQQQLLVPNSALVQRSEVSAVYVLSPEGAISLRQVRVGALQSGGYTSILAGLEAGEQVAIDPAQAIVSLQSQHASEKQ